MKQLLAKESSLCLLMEFALSETNAECLLSIVEFVQLKNALAEQCGDECGELAGNYKECPSHVRTLAGYRVPTGVPLSPALLLLDQPREACRLLYDKYVADSDSRLQINISSFTRRLVEEQLTRDDITVHELAHIFDECINETARLLVLIVSRFTDSPRFKNPGRDSEY